MAKDLPFELAQHVQTYYEESLFTQAYTFLLSITGNSISPTNRIAPVTVPAPPHLALAATVSVHPIFTTRTTSREKWEQANLAARLLRLVYQTVGPVNGNLLAAFSFPRYDSRSTRRAHFEDEEHDYDRVRNTDSLAQGLNTAYAGSQSLWTRADDFGTWWDGHSIALVCRGSTPSGGGAIKSCWSTSSTCWRPTGRCEIKKIRPRRA